MREGFLGETIIGRVLLIVAFPATDGNRKERKRKRKRRRRFAREPLAKGGVR